MIAVKTLNFKKIVQWTGHHVLWLSLWMSVVPLLHYYAGLTWLKIPWLPVSIIGTAVAFYVGFKNNSAYARMWEARKVWGGIINSSRAWGIVMLPVLFLISLQQQMYLPKS